MTYPPPQSGHVPVQPYQTTQPEYFQPRGAMLPQRTWQRRTRTVVIIGTVLGIAGLCAVAVLAVFGGVLSASSFTAKGYVVINCNATPSDVAPGSAVVIYGETGDGLGRGRLGNVERNDSSTCYMRFTIDDVRSGESGYLVQVGGVLQQTVSESALHDGVVLRPLS